MATLAPAPPGIAERVARHYAAEVRLARGLSQDAESLDRVVGELKKRGFVERFEGPQPTVSHAVSRSRKERGEP